MGYELDRLMQQYGLSSPTVGTYQGDPANTAERAAFDKYKADYTGRINITPQYMQDQYQTKKPDYNYLQTNPDVGAAYTSSGSTLSPEGFARQHYLNYGQYEGRTMPMLQGGQYWGNTLQAPQITPYNVPTATPPKTDFQQKFPDGIPNYGSGLGGTKYDNNGQGSNFIGGQFDNYNYGANPTLNKALVKAAPQLQQLMPGGFGGGAFNAAYLQLPEPSRKALDVVLARGYSKGGPVKVQDQTEQPEPVAQPDMRDELRQRYSDIDAMRQKYIGDAQSLIAQEQESLKNPDQSERYFRMAAALLGPSKTGTIGESLASASGVLAENAAIQRANRTKALELAIKSNQMGLEGAEAGLKSYGDLAEMDMNYRNRQMMMDAYLSNDPAMISRAGALTGNPQAVAYGGQLLNQKIADEKLETVYDEQGQAVRMPVGDLRAVARGAAGGLPSMGTAPIVSSGQAPQQTELGQSQASGQGVAAPKKFFAEKTPKQKADEALLIENKKQAGVKSGNAVEEYQKQAAAAAEAAASAKGFNSLLKDVRTGQYTPQKMALLKGYSSFTGSKLPDNIADQEAAEMLSNDSVMRSRGQFQKDPNMSNADREFLIKVSVNLRNTNEGNELIGLAQDRLAERKAMLAKFSAKWHSATGDLNTEQDIPGLGKVNFHDYAASISKRSLFDDIKGKYQQ